MALNGPGIPKFSNHQIFERRPPILEKSGHFGSLKPEKKLHVEKENVHLSKIPTSPASPLSGFYVDFSEMLIVTYYPLPLPPWCYMTALASLWKVATGAASYTFRSVGTAGGELTKTHTSAEVTQNGGFARESPKIPLNLGLGIRVIAICPCMHRFAKVWGVVIIQYGNGWRRVALVTEFFFQGTWSKEILQWPQHFGNLRVSLNRSKSPRENTMSDFTLEREACLHHQPINLGLTQP